MARPYRTIFAILLAAPALWAGERDSLADLLPRNTPLYFHVKSPTQAETEKMAAFGVLRDPQMKTLLERIFGDENSLTTMTTPLGPAGVSVRSDMTGQFIVDVRYVDKKGTRTTRIQNEVSCAWVGMTSEPSMPVDVVMAFHIAGDAGAARDLLERVVGAASLALRNETEGDVDAEMNELVSRSDHEGIGISRVAVGPVSFFMAPLRSMIVLTTTRARMVDLINRSRAKSRPPSFADNPRYAQALAAGAGTTTTYFGLNVDHAFDAIAKIQPDQVAAIRAFLANFGMAGWQGLKMTARVDGEGIASKLSMLFDGKRTGLASLFAASEPAQFKTLRFAPKETLYVASGRFDLQEFSQTVAQVMGISYAMGVESPFRAKFGIGLRDEILNHVGPEGALIVASSRGAIPDIGLVLECRDAARVQKAILHMCAHVDWPDGTGVQKFQIGKHSAHSIPLLHDKLAEFPICPTFGVVDGHLVIAAFPMTYQRIVATYEGRRARIDANPDFVKLRAHVPRDALGMSYLDIVSVTEFLYETAIPIIQSLPPGEGAPNLLHEMPEATLFSKNLFGRVGWRVADDTGMHWHSYSSVDTSGMAIGMLAGAAIGSAVFMRTAEPQTAVVGRGVPQEVTASEPAPEQARVRAIRVVRKDQSRVREWRRRLLLHHQEKGTFPLELKILEEAIDAKELGLVPGWKQPYAYLGPTGRNRILLHGYPNGPDKRVTVLTTRLRVQRVTSAELKAMLSVRKKKRDAGK